ncbi:acetate uptake transporter [Aciditerrimonas ferrireducens]|jgi:succinate-acetate transporter protein|uniref:Acetate uptake transporter n=1 Tax=Aciditerrimonas ferrireducens TaxID=667306 RepID=A0ABV6BZZ9_9ACTN|nr:acetate uptake transporter [Aciditerrimonas ferrireducens]MCK4176521.1 acetate uptake transporter [Aciditerrimonas ferrireducens]
MAPSPESSGSPPRAVPRSDSSSNSVGSSGQRVSPAPIAFGAFAGTTFLLSWVNTGRFSAPGIETAVATAWAFGGLVQLVVGFWHLRNDELFPAVTFGSFGAFWISFALFATLYLDQIPAASRGSATALFLVPWAVFSLYMLVGAVRVNLAVFVAYVLVEATVIALIVGDATGHQSAVHVGGWLGVVLAAEVWYIAAAEVLNHQFGRQLLPLGTRRRATLPSS